MKDIYERLRERIDDLGTGYPATESDVEIRILKRLFTERFAPMPYVAGIFDLQVNSMDRELALAMDEYYDTELWKIMMSSL